MNRTVVLSVLPALVAVSLFAAREEPVTVWRGETAAFRLHDHVSLGDVPAGFAIREGVAQEVRYLDRQFGSHYRFAADRVVWGSKEIGPRLVEIGVPQETKGGVYSCGDLRITVLDRVLPPAKDWKYNLDLWQHPWAVARYRGVKPFSSDHYEAMRPLWRMLADAGQKSLTTTLLDEPWNHQCYDAYRSMIRHVKRADGSWRFDYSVFDEYVRFGRSCGIGPQIACYTMCPWDYQVTWEDEAGRIFKERAVPGTEAFKEYWGDFLIDFAAHQKENGWFADTYIAMDERSPEDLMNIAKFVQEKAPGLKISLAGNRPPSQFEGVEIHNCCFALHKLSDELIAEAEARRRKGFITSYYVCCNPAWPNTFMSSETEEAFWLGVYPAMSGLDGLLRWAWNSWPRDPIRDASYTGILTGWKAGDTYLVYPDGSPSLRFLELKNGIQTAEKIRILRERGELPEGFGILAARFDRHAAVKGECDWTALRSEAIDLVNSGK